jgi:hypothetical protein
MTLDYGQRDENVSSQVEGESGTWDFDGIGLTTKLQLFFPSLEINGGSKRES